MTEWIGSGSLAAALAILHCAIGLGAALIARRRGLSGDHWLWWGLIGGTVALMAALVLSPKDP